jgi:thymidylate synthase (methanogen type)
MTKIDEARWARKIYANKQYGEVKMDPYVSTHILKARKVNEMIAAKRSDGKEINRDMANNKFEADRKTGYYGLPVICVNAETCGEAWEKTVEAVWYQGLDIEQHYKDKMSKEASVILNISDPLKEPRFSRKDTISVSMFMTGPDKKKPYREKEYVCDLIDGTMDYRVTEEGKESYTYHERFARWGAEQPAHEKLLQDLRKPHLRFVQNGEMLRNFEGIDQIQMLIQKAKQESISRKLQITTWQPHKDLLISGAPCLQRLWFRIIKDKYMVAESHWRSRDLFNAVGANMVGVTELCKWIAEQLNVQLVQYTDYSNSLHLYAKSYPEVERFLETKAKQQKHQTVSVNR